MFRRFNTDIQNSAAIRLFFFSLSLFLPPKILSPVKIMLAVSNIILSGNIRLFSFFSIVNSFRLKYLFLTVVIAYNAE